MNEEQKLKQKTRHHDYYLKNKTTISKQHVEWDKQNNIRLKKEAEEKLGGKCKNCGVVKKLQLHHKYYARDSIRSTQHETGQISRLRRKEAILHPKRFALLCLSCHNKLDPKRKKIVSLASFEEISRSVKEKMVEIEKAETGCIPYLKKSVVNDQGVKKVKIIEEPLLVEKDFNGKKSMKVEALCSTHVLDPKQVKWTMNATTQNYMIEKYGKDTKNWIGKEIEIAIKQAGSASPGVYPKDCSLERVIA